MHAQDHVQTISEAAVASAASKATYGGSLSAVLGWLVSSESAVLFGILVGVVGLVVNIVFSWRRDRREAKAHAAYMTSLENGAPDERH